MMNEELDNKINQVLSGWESPSILSKQDVWQKIEGEIESKTTISPLHTWRWAIAASILMVAVSLGVVYTSEVHIITENQKLAFTLPDGSTVDLNKQSSASYNNILWYFNRSVNLSGEGFFKVKKGKTFSVNTENGTVAVLGTSFNVLTRTNTFIVACFTGKVAVNNGKNATIITKGEMVSQSANLSLIKETVIALQTTPLWLTEDYSYKNEQLSSILEDISAHYRIEINTTSKINKLSFTGTWSKSMTLDEVLQIVCLPFDLEATTGDSKTYILSQKSN